MPREAGKATPTHKAYAAYLTETTGQKISHNTVQMVLGNLGAFRESDHYADLKNTEAETKAQRDEAKLEAKRAALRAKLAELGGDTPAPTKTIARGAGRAAAAPTPAKRAPRKAASPAPAPRGELRSVENEPESTDATDEFAEDDF